MRILHKAITADAILVSGDCYVIGAELNDAAEDAYLMIYNDTTTTAAQLLFTLRVSAPAETQFDSVMFPLPGIKCENVYANIDGAAALGTLFYYLG